MNWRAIKYALPLTLFVNALMSFAGTGWQVWTTFLVAFLLVPLLELILPATPRNLADEVEEMISRSSWFNVCLYLMVPLQFIALYLFLHSMQQPDISISDRLGRILAMGLLCGIFGINVGHELGHRVSPLNQFLSRSMLLSSLYMHFNIDHNKGHHKNVATPLDPGSALYNESLYHFIIRMQLGTYRVAWTIAAADQRKDAKSFIHNKMFQFTLVELAFCALIVWLFGWQVFGYYILSALSGILLFQAVSYIQHYGLSRKPTGEGRYERVMPRHSWDSDHILGRLILFELGRHSDHHYLASRRYQVLRHHDEAPQLPTGYAGSIVLATIPALWFSIMNKRIAEKSLS
jgi:alkane 1-monooxygenase